MQCCFSCDLSSAYLAIVWENAMLVIDLKGTVPNVSLKHDNAV